MKHPENTNRVRGKRGLSLVSLRVRAVILSFGRAIVRPTLENYAYAHPLVYVYAAAAGADP